MTTVAQFRAAPAMLPLPGFGEHDLITILARLLISFQARNSGYHGSGRHIGMDFELCGAYDGSDGTEYRPYSPRCAAVACSLEAAARYLGVEVEALRGWPKRMKTGAQTVRTPEQPLGLFDEPPA
jgi:hypothetical protein